VIFHSYVNLPEGNGFDGVFMGLFHCNFMVIQYDSMGMSDWIVHGDFHGEIILSHPLRLTMLEIGAV
jgi:hypothetical protein